MTQPTRQKSRGPAVYIESPTMEPTNDASSSSSSSSRPQPNTKARATGLGVATGGGAGAHTRGRSDMANVNKAPSAAAPSTLAAAADDDDHRPLSRRQSESKVNNSIGGSGSSGSTSFRQNANDEEKTIERPGSPSELDITESIVQKNKRSAAHHSKDTSRFDAMMARSAMTSDIMKQSTAKLPHKVEIDPRSEAFDATVAVFDSDDESDDG